MFSGLNLFIGIFIFLTVNAVIAESSKCTQNNVTEVNKCFSEFQQEIFSKYNVSNLLEYYHGYRNKTKTWKGIEEICEVSKSLHECLDRDLIENCINFNDFSFDSYPLSNRFYVLNFLQIDYYCEKGYEILKNNFHCLLKDVKYPSNISFYDCNARPKYIEYKTNLIKNHCESEEAACFTKIYETFEVCSLDCEMCKTVNKNSAKNLCDDIHDDRYEGNRNGASKYFFVVFNFCFVFVFLKLF